MIKSSHIEDYIINVTTKKFFIRYSRLEENNYMKIKFINIQLLKISIRHFYL